MKFENTKVYNMCEALGAMRLSYRSASDSVSDCMSTKLGPMDEEVAKELISLGPSHRKFMRQILLTVDITAPRYWWMQFDTYKVGVTACSESTMHTLMKRPITKEDFEGPVPDDYISYLESLRKDDYFGCLVNCLPQGYKQKRHVTMNYEVVRNIREQRKGHKLIEWLDFCKWSDRLPHANLFFGGNK